MSYNAFRTCSFTNSRRYNRIGLDVLGFRHRGVTRLPQCRHVIDVNSQAQSTHVIAPNRTQPLSLSKSERCVRVKCANHSPVTVKQSHLSFSDHYGSERQAFDLLIALRSPARSPFSM